MCGCGVADTDTDGDGTPDCNDACPNDPTKVAGVCGCGGADGPRGCKQAVLADLTALRASISNRKDKATLADAIDHLTKSVSSDRWIDASHPKSGAKGEGVFNEEKPVVMDLRDLRMSNGSGIAPTLMQAYIDRLLAADRVIATIAISDAVARHGNAGKISMANTDLGKGDVEAGKDHPDKAIDQYKNAWKDAGAA